MNVSRVTVRRAIEGLISMGLINQRQGRAPLSVIITMG